MHLALGSPIANTTASSATREKDMLNIDLRFGIQDHTVDPATTARFIQELILGKLNFIESVEVLADVGVPTLTRAERPIQSGEEG